jgi:hypothetical protein
MNGTRAQVSSIREVNQLNPETQKIEPYMVVTFKVGSHGPFVESFLKSTFDPNGVNARLMDFASKLGLVQGQ